MWKRRHVFITLNEHALYTVLNNVLKMRSNRPYIITLSIRHANIPAEFALAPTILQGLLNLKNI